jgi:multicomponent Na+:H+ antiporter subunit E
MNKGENIFSGLPAVVRWLVFLGTWFVLYGPDLAALPVGVGAAVAATWTSLRLLPPGSFHPQLGSLFVLALRFVWQSVVAGIDVARRALEPRLPLRPGVWLLVLVASSAVSQLIGRAARRGMLQK